MTMNDSLNKKESGEFKGVYYAASSNDREQVTESEYTLQSSNKDKQIEDMIAYNDRVLTEAVDYKFHNLEFTGGRILLRMLNKIPKKGSLITVNKLKIPKAKPGEFDEIDNPYPFSDVGVVISHDPNIDYVKVGEIVQVEQQIITPTIGFGNQLYLPSAYSLYNTLPDDKVNYGYVICYGRNIICKIKTLYRDE